MNDGDWLLVIALAAPSIGVAIYYALDIPLRKASMSWPVTVGVVIKSEITYRNDGEPPSASILYQYTVGTREFRTNRYRVGSYSCFSGNNEESVEQHLARYPKGAEVVVYYDPSNPAYGARERGFSESYSRTSVK